MKLKVFFFKEFKRYEETWFNNFDIKNKIESNISKYWNDFKKKLNNIKN
jgi:hypothetical protein